MAVTVHFVTVVGGRHVHLLSRLIRHYRYLGINGRWIINVHMATPEDPIVDIVEAILRPFGLEISTTVVGPWKHRVNPGVISRVRGLYPDDWCVIADHDEFHVYPDDLQSTVERCIASGYDAVTGRFLDRVAVDGSLLPVLPKGSLWDRFPLGGDVTLGILGECNPKTVLARGDVLVGWGNHLVFRGNVCPTAILDVAVHHFKWDATLLARLHDRYALYLRHGEICAHESDAFLAHVAAHGRIDVDDPALSIRYVGNPYGPDNLLD